ncbi:MAG: 1-deoxy-D-xylulose-5-phosphate reductoisomerase [Clostridiales bacterium]|nr:1-deoxy-D-xylulose-5-phosphate reductoisomerase [Clostridiales bacterium]
MKRICVLGSTGSIGVQGLKVIYENKDRFKVSVLTCNKNIHLLREQIILHKPEAVVVADEEGGRALRKEFPGLEVLISIEGLIEAVSSAHDMILNGIVGIAGLLPTYYGLKNKNSVALANKEALVTGGHIIMELSQKTGASIIPVDSEHSAIFQCLEGNKQTYVKRLILTASGGPFLGKSLKELSKVTVKEALNHPKWSMGRKITIDSATLMNKGLEIIEARWLFNQDYKNIDVVIHKESIVHSMVEFIDGSILGQMGKPDMRVPISYALSYPERLASFEDGPDFLKEGSSLSFSQPDYDTFKCLDLARQAGEMGGSYPVALNGANEVLVHRFLKGEIPFLGIQEGVERALSNHKGVRNPKLEEILKIDEEVRNSI